MHSSSLVILWLTVAITTSWQQQQGPIPLLTALTSRLAEQLAAFPMALTFLTLSVSVNFFFLLCMAQACSQFEEHYHFSIYMKFRNLRCFFSGEYLGAEPTLPYLSPELRGERLLVGANFASAGIGILNDTGIQFVSIEFMQIYIYIYSVRLLVFSIMTIAVN